MKLVLKLDALHFILKFLVAVGGGVERDGVNGVNKVPGVGHFLFHVTMKIHMVLRCRQLSGGVKERLTYEDVKYTLNAERVSWVQAVYPVLNQVIDVASSTLIDEWRYSGPVVTHMFAEPEDTVASEVATVMVDVTTPPRVCVFGGCVYELLNDTYPNARLHNFTDPTGDVDVEVILPPLKSPAIQQLITTMGEEQVLSVPVFAGPFELNPLYASFLTHMHSALVNRLRQAPELTHSPYFERMLPGEYDCEGVRQTYAGVRDAAGKGFMETVVGNVVVVTFPDLGETSGNTNWYGKSADTVPRFGTSSDVLVSMLKTQMVVKAGGVVDHVLEFVTLPSTLLKSKRYLTLPYKFPNGRTMDVQNLEALVWGNMDALKARGPLMDTTKHPRYFHKGVNHVNRLLYLFEFMHHYKGAVPVLDVEMAVYGFLMGFSSTFKQFNMALPFFKRHGSFLQRVDVSLQLVLEAYEDVVQYAGGGYSSYYDKLSWFVKNVSLPTFKLRRELKGVVPREVSFVSPRNEQAHNALMTLVVASVEEVRLLKRTRDQAATLAALTAALQQEGKL